MPEDFFEDPSEQSQVKAQIVSKYFEAWAQVIAPRVKRMGGKLAFVDLFSGPGRYEDGTESTPLLVLKAAIENQKLRQVLVTIFNDKNPEYASLLQEAIASLPGIGSLTYKPQVTTLTVGEEIAEGLDQRRLVPTLLFVDPWGYKGLSLRLIGAVLKDWGSECIVFFNYNRIHPGLYNAAVKEHMDALFGEERAERLREQLQPMAPDEREITIIEALMEALKEIGGKYVLAFRFRNASGHRTSHHLIFVTKHAQGYKIMKGIMASESSSREQGVSSFEYNPATLRQPLLFALSRPLDDLEVLLLEQFAGRTITMLDIYNEHNIGTPYVEANYKQVLARLEREGQVIADPPAEQRRKRKGETTFGDNVKVTFPGRVEA